MALSLPPIKTAADVVAALGAVADAMAAGELTPEEASAVSGVFEAKRKAIETAALEDRVQRLEQTLGGRPMTMAALDRRLRKLEAVLPDDDPRRYLGQPPDLWPDATLERLAAMNDAEYAELLKSHPHRSERDDQ